jgi:hypothetical protein
MSIISACPSDSSASRAEIETLEILDFGSLEDKKKKSLVPMKKAYANISVESYVV